ncbi:phage regulatory CII family protein [Chitinibacteraceae bacterium HSL-7]
MDSLMEAAQRDAKAWRGTQESLSFSLFGSPAGLRHKLVGFRNSVLSLEDAQQLMLVTGGRHTIAAQARELGGVFLQLPELVAELDNADLLGEFQRVIDRVGALTRALNEAVANDGEIDAVEQKQLAELRHQLHEQVLRYLMLSVRVYGTPEAQAAGW